MNIMNYIKIALITLLCTVGFVSCNDTDDVSEIFTGKTWKMIYITAENEHYWYNFPDIDKKVYESYDPINGSRAFRITFEGVEENGIIDGDMVGTGSVQLNGKWQANGKSNDFRTSVRNSSVKDPADAIGKIIAEGMRNAYAYAGDSRNLFIYFKYKNKGHAEETLCISFKPSK